MVSKVNAASVARSERIIGRATCLAGDTVGACVYITGDKVGNLFQVATVDVTDPAKTPSVGIILKKNAATDCYVQFQGPVVGVYSGLTAGAVYVVGTDGQPAKSGDANYPGVGDFLQNVGVATGVDELLLIPFSSELDLSSDHELLDTLVHKIAETSETELIYTSGKVTSVIVWTDAGKTLKIRESTLSYTGDILTGLVVQQYDGSGSVVSTITKTLNYTGNDLTSVAAVKS